MTSVPKTKVQTALPRGRISAVILALQLMLLLAAIDQTIISTAMPKIIAQLGGFDRYAWATTAYLLSSTVCIPVFGSLSDMYGRKWFLIAGVSIFVVASVLCAAAGSIPELTGASLQFDAMNQFIAARTLQGLGAGIVLGLCFSVVADLFPPAERGKYQGHFAAVFAIASIVGPTLGGWISDHSTWRWLFIMNVPVGLAAIALFNASFPSDRKHPSQPNFDYGGIALFLAAFVPLLFALSCTPRLGWLSAVVVASFSGAIVMLVWFLRHELRQEQPFIKVQLLFNPIVALSCASVFVTGIGMFGSIMLLPIFFQSVSGMSAANSGALLTPLIVTVALTSIVGGNWLSRRKTYKVICLVGMFCMTAGTLLLSRIEASSPLAYILGNMLLVGAGLGLLLPVYTVVIQNAVAEKDVGSVTGFSQFFRSVGGTTGVAVFGTLMLGLYEQSLAKVELRPLSTQAVQLIQNPLEPAKLRHSLELLSVPSQQLASVLNAVKDSLITSIDVIFLLYGLLTAATLVATIFLKEVPLRESQQSPV